MKLLMFLWLVASVFLYMACFMVWVFTVYNKDLFVKDTTDLIQLVFIVLSPVVPVVYLWRNLGRN